MRTASFVAEESGDGECFLFRGVSKEDKIAVIGEENYLSDYRLEEDYQKEHARDFNQPYNPATVERVMEQLYPGEILAALGVQRGKRYRFTVSVEEVD